MTTKANNHIATISLYKLLEDTLISEDQLPTEPKFINGISTDTRTLQEGDLFIPLKGKNFDGHEFIELAFSKGGAYSLSETKPINALQHQSHNIFEVQNTTRAYGTVARNYRRTLLNTKFIAVTGSVGKTTTKNLLGYFLQPFGSTHTSLENLNNQIGVPKTILEISPHHKFAVVEMAMRKSGEISDLSHIAEPDIAVITNIGPAHLEFFNSTAEISVAKSEIFDALSQSGVAILNQDMLHFDIAYEEAKNRKISNILTFSASGNLNANVALKQYKIHNDQTATLNIDVEDRTIEIKLPFYNWSLVENSLAAVAVLLALNLDLGNITDVLKNFDPLHMKGRGLIIKLKFREKELMILDETYNSSPLALQAALMNLRKLDIPGKTFRKIAIIGEMKELGQDSPSIHKNIAPHLEGIDLIFTVGGSDMLLLTDAIPAPKFGGHFDNSKLASVAISKHLNDGDALMIKGSKSMEMWNIIDFIGEDGLKNS